MKVYNGKLKYKDPTTKEFKTLPIGANLFYSNTPGIEFDIAKLEDFTMANNAKKITVPEGVVSLGNYPFGSNGFSYPGVEVSLPASLETIGNCAFQNAKGLYEIELPKGLKKIGEAAFQNSGLTTIIIPQYCTSIGTNAFKGCTSLEKIIIKNKNLTSGSPWGAPSTTQIVYE